MRLIDLAMLQNCRAYALKDLPKDVQATIGEYRKDFVRDKIIDKDKKAREEWLEALRRDKQMLDRFVKQMCARVEK